MTGTVMEYPHNVTGSQRRLALDTGTRDAIADLCRERWPSNTAKLAAREWRLTLDQARSAVAGRASQTTIDQIYKTGGWPILFAVGARLVGRGADQYISELRASHEQQASRLGALLGDPWPVLPHRHDDPRRVDSATGERRFTERRREGQG